MRIKLSQSDWKSIGQSMGWLKTAQAFQGFSGFDKTTAEHFAKAALIAKEKAVKAARSLDGSRGEDNMAKAATETYPSFTACSTTEEREECWYELENYCQHLDGTLEDMRLNSGGIPRREGIHALSALREAMGMKTSSGSSMEKNAGRGTCWEGWEQKGMKEKGGRMVPNCVRKDKKG
jgi:hypothetical protein